MLVNDGDIDRYDRVPVRELVIALVALFVGEPDLVRREMVEDGVREVDGESVAESEGLAERDALAVKVTDGEWVLDGVFEMLLDKDVDETSDFEREADFECSDGEGRVEEGDRVCVSVNEGLIEGLEDNVNEQLLDPLGLFVGVALVETDGVDVADTVAEADNSRVSDALALCEPDDVAVVEGEYVNDPDGVLETDTDVVEECDGDTDTVRDREGVREPCVAVAEGLIETERELDADVVTVKETD